MAPIVWYSKRQSTVETAVFGAEFQAMKAGIEASRALRYKLRMMGIPIEDPTFVYGDNMSVIHNVTKPESTLKKKSAQISYHFCQESMAMGESIATHISTHSNPSDICSKCVPGGAKREQLVSMILYDIFDDHEDK